MWLWLLAADGNIMRSLALFFLLFSLSFFPLLFPVIDRINNWFFVSLSPGPNMYASVCNLFRRAGNVSIWLQHRRHQCTAEGKVQMHMWENRKRKCCHEICSLMMWFATLHCLCLPTTNKKSEFVVGRKTLLFAKHDDILKFQFVSVVKFEMLNSA